MTDPSAPNSYGSANLRGLGILPLTSPHQSFGAAHSKPRQAGTSPDLHLASGKKHFLGDVKCCTLVSVAAVIKHSSRKQTLYNLGKERIYLILHFQVTIHY